MGKPVLIIGQSPDTHIEQVASLLGDLGSVPIIFDCFNGDHKIELCVNATGPSGTVWIGDERWPFEAFEAVWWRWKPISGTEWTGAFTKVGHEFASREWRATLRSLPTFLAHAKWVNPLTEHINVARKPSQLALAHSVGFRLPDTLFTNNPERALRELSNHRRLVYKTISSFFLPPNKFIFTNEISEAAVRESLTNIRRAPCTFQELIDKSYELRVTIVGQEVFALRINSQRFRKTSLDWRRRQLSDMYEIATLSGDLAAQLLSFQARAGLLFGTYDLIVCRDGSPIFLECNPGGQWLWLELKLGLRISEAVARLLA